MHTVVIHQIDQEITSVLKPLRDLGPGTQAVPSGDKVFIQGLNPLVGPKGRMDSQGQFGFRAILAFAHELLSSEASDLARLQVVFIFHQTSGAAVKGVMDTMRLIRDTGVLPALTGLHGKRLKVEIVNVLSCESAADKAVSPPVDPVLQPYVDQARVCASWRRRRVRSPGHRRRSPADTIGTW